MLWETYKGYNNTKLKFGLLEFLEFPINMTAIRGGLVDYGEGTPLYDLLEEKKLLDAVSLITPPETHFYYLKKLLSKNFFVICDKPLVISSAEIKKIK